MDRTQTTGRQPHGTRRLLLPAATMAGLALAASFGVTKAMEGILLAQGGEAVEPLAEGTNMHATADIPAETPPLRAFERTILGRNIFDSRRRTGPGSPVPPILDVAIDGAQLIATVVTEDHQASTALIALGSGEQQFVDVYGLGDRLLEEGRITHIDQGRVTLLSPVGEVQHLRMGMRAEL